EEAEAVARVDDPLEERYGDATNVGGIVRRFASCGAAGDRPEVRVAEFERDRAGLAAVVVKAAADLVREATQIIPQFVAVGEIAGERRLRADGLALGVRFDGAVVFAASELLEEGAAGAERAFEQRRIGGGQVPDGADGAR